MTVVLTALSSLHLGLGFVLLQAGRALVQGIFVPKLVSLVQQAFGPSSSGKALSRSFPDIQTSGAAPCVPPSPYPADRRIELQKL